MAKHNLQSKSSSLNEHKDKDQKQSTWQLRFEYSPSLISFRDVKQQDSTINQKKIKKINQLHYRIINEQYRFTSNGSLKKMKTLMIDYHRQTCK